MQGASEQWLQRSDRISRCGVGKRRFDLIAKGARSEKELQKYTDEHVHQVDELLKHKEAEILEV